MRCKRNTVKNWHAINLETGEECGHAHHSKEHAERCADVKGWTRYQVCTFWNTHGKDRVKEHFGSKNAKYDPMYNRHVGKCMVRDRDQEWNRGDSDETAWEIEIRK